MAPPTRRFANHPGAKEAPASALEYRLEKDQNPPPLRGLPLAIASVITQRLGFVQKLLWTNAKFGQAKYTPGLEGVAWRIQPDVIPLANGDSPPAGMLALGPELHQPQPADLAGRFYSAADYHALYKSGAATPLQVAEALLPLVRRDDAQQPRSKYAVAWTQTDVDAVRAAARASTERWAAGAPLGIMDGVPFGVKDDVAVKGFVSTMGMRVNEGEEYFKQPKTETAWPVRKLEEAGGIMIGKMNQHEIGMELTPVKPSTGTATNWYNKSYYPGGSSAGAGSALSGGIVPITIGTDAGGSMRIPPAFCGVYGLKPTHNRTCHMSSSMCVIGPMAANAADLTIAYRIASQPNPDDPAQNLLAVSTPLSDPAAKKYLGICREWIATAAPDVLAILDASLAHLTTTLNYQVVDIKLPFLREGQLAHSAICLTECAADARGRVQNPSRFLTLLNYPNRVLVAAGAQTPAIDYLKYGQIRQVIMQHLAFLFQKYPGLLVLSPTTPVAGWPIAAGDQRYGCLDGNMTIRNMTFAWLANMSGCPAVTFPAGYVDPEQGEGVLPVGLMAMGEWGMEEQLLGFAREREGYLNEVYPGGRRRPEEWADVVGLVREGGGKGACRQRAMVYRWEQHRQTCYRLYVEENRPMDEVVRYMRDHHNFTPSRRAFQGAFCRWGFPNKLNPAYKNEQLVARVRELWERSLSQKEMVATLTEEGYDVGEREVARIRFKNGWLMRTITGYPADSAEQQRSVSAEGGEDGVDGGLGDGNSVAAGGVHEDQSNYWNYGASGLEPADAQVQEETFNAMREAQKECRKRAYEAESHERWMTKKRRRHTKPYGGLPADPPGPPRFPSETTLTEAKEILQLDKKAYRTVREKFYAICVNAAVYKKTLVGPERWESLKDQLVRESMHLRAVMWDPTDIDKKKLAIEVIACDVTKRIRTEASAMKMADAKVILGLNPEEGRLMRGQLYNILAQEKFTSKFEEGLEFFEELKQRIVAAGPADPEYQRKIKAINVLCRDATRRYRDDVFRRGKTPAILLPPPEKPATPKPKAKKQSAKVAGKKAVQETTPAKTSAPTSEPAATETPAPPSQPRRRGRPPGVKNKKKPLPHVESRLVLADPEPQADQQLVDAQLGASMPVSADNQTPFVVHQYVPGFTPAQQTQTYQPQQPQHQDPPPLQQQAAQAPSSSGAIAAFFRLNSAAVMMFPGVQAQWIAPLNARTMAELRSAALQKTPGGLCYKIEGIVKDGKGGELPLPVSDEGELETYLQHVQGHGAPTFHVHVVPGDGATWA
ncbi:amidase signature domain-containing protein [Parachaetomium inaequale]|uniref:Amidase signature domain-containing protein n=1 Tax=Parachaetomium inaequale TaxID=2588326 RepID=A0AAN6STM3_9PEZI|nr:amidase signature domain-containing protein [Parachaetomium inaequale]